MELHKQSSNPPPSFSTPGFGFGLGSGCGYGYDYGSGLMKEPRPEAGRPTGVHVVTPLLELHSKKKKMYHFIFSTPTALLYYRLFKSCSRNKDF